MVSIRSVSRTQWLSQLGLSICATVMATLLVTGIQHEVSTFTSGPARPAADVTSGGKFAARVEALRASPDALPTPPSVPLLAADAVLQALPASFAPRDPPALVDFVKPARRMPHVEVRRRLPTEIARDVLPPKRVDQLAEMSAAAPTADDGDATVWSTAKGVYRQAVALGGTALDRINPLNLIP